MYFVMAKKIKVGLIFGGRSGEHEISLVSAWNIFHGLDRKKYEIWLLGIDKKGAWHLGSTEAFWQNPTNPEKVKLNSKTPLVTVVRKQKEICVIDLQNGKNLAKVEVFFPITHGSFGEDGCLQGMLEMLDAPFVGPGVLGSSVGMDKDVAKRLLQQAGLAVSKFHILKSSEAIEKKLPKIIADLKFPIFVKPANLGSSVGISKAQNKSQLLAAIELAFQYDSKIILEQTVIGREIECSVLGNENPMASIPGEIKLGKDFYSYAAKYVDAQSATPVVKADLPAGIAKKIQQLALQVFEILGCEGMGRVDFFLTEKNEIFVNEINTLPGFTSISMYPKMLEQSGIAYGDLLDKLIELALARKTRQQILKRDFKN